MKRWDIPDDWNEEQDGFSVVLFCIPNSRRWRGLITGLIESLSFGWSWDERTGTVTEVQELGRNIFETFCMATCADIVTQLTRIADAVEGLEQREGPTITLDDATLAALKAIIDGWEATGGSAVGQALKTLKDFLEMMTFLKALLPSPPKFPLGQFIQITLDALFRSSQLRAQWQVAMNGKVSNLLNGGDDLVDAGIEFDDYLKIVDVQWGATGIKKYIPALGWLFGIPAIEEVDIEAVIQQLYLYFKNNDPDHGTIGSVDLEVLRSIANAVKSLDLQTNININNGCGCEGECTCGESQQVFSTNGAGGGGEVPLEFVDVN